MKKDWWFLPLVFFASMVSCTSSDDGQEESFSPKDSSVNFSASIKPITRATETAFETGDAVSVFAVDPKVGMELKASGNYADNVKYIYQGNRFEAGTGAITISENNTTGLAYYAIYPYSQTASNSFTYTVKSDQSTHDNYTLSDLCTAFGPQTTAKTVNLEFSHRLSNIIIKFYGENLTSKNIKVQLENVYKTCKADINSNTYKATGSKGSIIMGEESSNAFHAIIVPQSVPADETFMTVTMNGETFKLSLSSDREFKSGKQTIFEYEVRDNEIIELNGYINPWDTEDERLESVVPEEILEKLNDHMPIYTGVNPPNVEGAYYIDRTITVYCEDYGSGGYEPGHIVNSETIRFSNQDDDYNTLDYEEYSPSGTYAEGKGAFISGSGNNFTAFFNTSGKYSDGITTYKTALVISGTKTSTGIKDLYYSFIMVEKNDPNDQLMEEGVYRVFKDEDGLSVNTTWNFTRSLQISNDIKRDVYSFVK